MSQKKGLVIIAVCLLAAAIIFVIFRNQDNTGDKAHQAGIEDERNTSRTKPTPAQQPEAVDSQAPGTRSQSSGPKAESSPAEVDQILKLLHDAEITYDAAELPKINPYLLHHNAEVREAALNAMVNLGDAAAGPLLRDAASKAPSPHEAVALLEAADYVELPPAKIRFKKKE